MNTRLNELITASGIGRSNEDLQEFAKLIIIECSTVCYEHSRVLLRFSQFGSNAAEDCSKMILQHFENTDKNESL
jgi:hypothetical protein